MTDIDPKALEHACQCAGRSVHHFDRMALDLPLRASIVAHARAIEHHEAFKLEVSDAITEYFDGGIPEDALGFFHRFIIAKPDPLVEALDQMLRRRQFEPASEVVADEAAWLRAALAARGLKIVEVGHD